MNEFVPNAAAQDGNVTPQVGGNTATALKLFNVEIISLIDKSADYFLN